jgi:hypothetical protein
MHKFLSVLMMVLGLGIGIYLYLLLLSAFSWKIFRVIYNNYTLGLLFPFATHRLIFIILVVLSFILIFITLHIINNLPKHFK